MSKNIPNKDISTQAIILKRTNYGEADRILKIITPSGKYSAIAKASRREKSKLAGGIEIFSLVNLNLHQGKSELATVTSARMIKSYHGIIKDYPRMEFASESLKIVNQVSENSDNQEYFEILNQLLNALHDNCNLDLAKIWFKLNIVKASGEDINLYRDTAGEKLNPETNYVWDYHEKALSRTVVGNISANEIKAMRLILSSKLSTVQKIKNIGELIPPISQIAQSL